MQQRVQFFHRRDSPSSTTQLPIMAALHAEKLTLFVAILQDVIGKVKPLLINLYQLYKYVFPCQPGKRGRERFLAPKRRKRPIKLPVFTKSPIQRLPRRTKKSRERGLARSREKGF